MFDFDIVLLMYGLVIVYDILCVFVGVFVYCEVVLCKLWWWFFGGVMVGVGVGVG